MKQAPDLGHLPGIDPAWSHEIDVEDSAGVRRHWHYLDNGAEPTVGTMFCIHGNPTWSYLWRGLLAAAPPGWRVVAPDQLGMGWSERLSSPRTLAQRVDDLGTLSDALGITGPTVTVGHDWGGVISLGWAVAHTDQLVGVVAGNTAVHQPDGDRGPAVIKLAHVPVVRNNACVRTPTFVRGTTLLSWPPIPREVRDAFSSPYETAARRQSVGDFVADIPFADDHPSRPALDVIAEGVAKLDVPALFFWGPNDPVFGERYLQDLLERMPHADVHRYQGASHLVTEDAPQYAGAVAAWVSGLGGGLETVARATSSATIRETVARATSSATGGSLWSAVEARADDPSAAVVEVGGRTASWGALAARVRDLATGFAAAGIRPGDRIGMLLEPSTDLTAVVYAAWRAGAVVVVADKGLGFLGMRRALRSASLDHVIGSAKGLAAARAMGLPCPRISLSDLDGLAARGSRRATVPPEPLPDQDCVVVFTSGATGPAKGVVYRHRQVMAQVELLRSTYALTPDDRFVAAFAPFALLGPALGIGSAVPDIDVTAPGTLTAPLLAEAAAAVDATLVFASPAALRNVLATGDRLTWGQRETLGKVRLLMSAGAPVPAPLLQSMAEVMPNAEAHTPYGMTECLPVADISLPEILAAGVGEGVCVGRPVPGVEVAIDETNAEITVRGAHVKDRYDGLWATEHATRDRDWHRTGDVGHLDDEGRLWVEGRLVHVVSTAAGTVTPVGVEQRVERLPEVGSSAAVGVGPQGTQQLVVVVVPSGRRPRGMRLADAGLTDAVRAEAGTEVAAVLVTDELPLDIRHASKIDRAEVARRADKVLAGR